MPASARVARSEPADDTRTKLLKAASEIFSEHGFERATVRDICRQAGVNVALVNYHFGDKLELYLAVVRQAIDAEAKMAIVDRALEENPDPCDALRQIIHGALERLTAKRDCAGLHFRVMLQEITNPTPALARVIDETLRPLYDRMRTVIGKILGLPIDHSKTRLCTHSVVGQMSHYAHARPIMAHLWPEMTMTPQQREMVANHIADFTLAYLKAERPQEPLAKAAKARRRRI